MIKKHLKSLIIATLILLLPVLAGVILWDQLPAQMPTHFNAAGEVDGWSSKAFAVFGLPMILVAAEWLCMVGTSMDPKKKGHPEKVVKLVLWIIPVLSIVMHVITYAVALGREVRVEVIMPLLMGVIFIIIGNYLPKCRQNYTIGIKIPWTLVSEENWNRTHRMAGKLWVAGGIATLLTAFLGGFAIFIGIVVLMAFVPFIYSYLLFRKGI